MNSNSEAHSSNDMAVPAGKTPISYLQELCTKRGMTPQYDLVAHEGAVHEPQFVFRVTIGENVANGRGSSKKKAKHDAALQALRMLGQLPDFRDEIHSGAGDASNAEQGEEVIPGNPIGELQEYSQKNMIKPPMYEFTEEPGPIHSKKFICQVKLGKHQEKAVAKSKKDAKRAAAYMMIQYLRSLQGDSEQPFVPEELDEDDEIPLPSNAYSSLKRDKMMISKPEDETLIEDFYKKLSVSDNEALKTLKSEVCASGRVDYCRFLQEIARVQKLRVTYMDLEEPSLNELRQCLVQLNTVPITVYHGSGATIEDAHAQAAHNALHHLKIKMNANQTG